MSSGMNGIDWFKDRSLKHGWVICLQCLQRFGWTKALYADILWIQQNDHQAKLTQLRCNLSELAVESQSESLCHSWGNGGASNACPPLLLDYHSQRWLLTVKDVGRGKGAIFALTSTNGFWPHHQIESEVRSEYKDTRNLVSLSCRAASMSSTEASAPQPSNPLEKSSRHNHPSPHPTCKNVFGLSSIPVSNPSLQTICYFQHWELSVLNTVKYITIHKFGFILDFSLRLRVKKYLSWN